MTTCAENRSIKTELFLYTFFQYYSVEGTLILCNFTGWKYVARQHILVQVFRKEDWVVNVNCLNVHRNFSLLFQYLIAYLSLTAYMLWMLVQMCSLSDTIILFVS